MGIFCGYGDVIGWAELWQAVGAAATARKLLAVNKFHHTVKLLVASVLVTLLAGGLDVTHYCTFASNGRGLPGVHLLAVWLTGVSEVLRERVMSGTYTSKRSNNSNLSSNTSYHTKRGSNDLSAISHLGAAPADDNSGGQGVVYLLPQAERRRACQDRHLHHHLLDRVDRAAVLVPLRRAKRAGGLPVPLRPRLPHLRHAWRRHPLALRDMTLSSTKR
eukprot:1187827-Prorocentrum_minimum.AAC.8